MQASLEIQSGPRAGEIIVVKEGQTITVGRTSNANFALPQDTFLSRVHFAVECVGSLCRVVDRQSANGTVVNGVKVSGAEVVSEGDVILAGETKFLVHITIAPQSAETPVPDHPGAPLISSPETPVFAAPPDTAAVGSWFFGIIPDGWQVIEGFGLRRRERNSFPSEAMVSEATLASGQTFEQYIESQINLVRLLVAQPQIEPAEPPAIAGVEEAKAFVMRYKVDDSRRFFQRQIYVRRGQNAGALTVTTLENEIPVLQPFLDQILRGLSFGRLRS